MGVGGRLGHVREAVGVAGAEVTRCVAVRAQQPHERPDVGDRLREAGRDAADGGQRVDVGAGGVVDTELLGEGGPVAVDAVGAVAVDDLEGLEAVGDLGPAGGRAVTLARGVRPDIAPPSASTISRCWRMSDSAGR